MPTEQQNVDDLKAIYRVSDCVDVYKATAAMAAAITEELKPVTESDINAIWQSMIEPEDYKYVTERDGRMVFGIPLLFKRYADFAVSLGEQHLGQKTADDDIMADDWITKSMPKTRVIFSALMELCVDFLSEASAEIKKATGTTPGEVFVQAINTGESFEQSHTRLSHASNGLRVVKPGE